MNTLFDLLTNQTQSTKDTFANFLFEEGLPEFSEYLKKMPENDWQTKTPPSFSLPNKVSFVEKPHMAHKLQTFFCSEQNFNISSLTDFFLKTKEFVVQMVAIDPNTQLKQPLMLPSVTSGLEVVFIMVGKHAQVDVTRLSNANSFRGSILFLCLDEGAEVHFHSFHNGLHSYQVSLEHIFLKDKAQLTCRLGSFEQTQGYHLISATSLGNNTHTTIDTAFSLDENKQHILKIQKHFIGHGCAGHLNAYGLLEDAARATVEGKIVIGAKANGTDSSLHEKILLLGEKAKCTALPVLEINTDDVKAGHGASISQINEEDLFYLLSRGISRKEAIALLKRGFFLAPFADIKKDHPWRKELEKAL